VLRWFGRDDAAQKDTLKRELQRFGEPKTGGAAESSKTAWPEGSKRSIQAAG